MKDNPLNHLTIEEREAVEYCFLTTLAEVRGDINFLKAYRRSQTMDAERIHHAISYLLDGVRDTVKEIFAEMKEGYKVADTSAIEVETIPVGKGDSKLY